LGTAAETTRGMDGASFVELAAEIVRILEK
jgi:glycine/serine hydroxymethyltransferase